jgi:Effector Associated Constant Component 1
MQTLNIELGETIEGVQGPSLEESDSALRVLWREISEIDGVEVHGRGTPVPNAAKSGEIAALNALLVTLLGSRAIVTLCNALRDWITRYKSFRLKIKKGSDVIEISGVDPAKLNALLPQVKRLLDRD